MNVSHLFALILMLLAAGGALVPPDDPLPAARAAAPAQGLPYPPTRTVDITDTFWATQVSDPYRWLEDETATEVKSWMTAEDGLARRELDRLPGRLALRHRFEALLRVESLGLPVPAGDYVFFTRRPVGKDKSILYRRHRDGTGEKVLIDPNDASFGATNALGSWTPSQDGTKLAYVVHPNNADEGVMEVLDTATGTKSDTDRLEGADYTDAQWLPDGSGFYYQYFPHDTAIPDGERQGHIAIRFHKLGEAQAKDVVAHPPTGDPNLWLSPSLSADGRWLFAYIYYGWSGVEIKVRDLSKPAGTFQSLFKSTDTSASVIAWRDRFTIWTNDGAPHGKLYATAADKLSRADWQLIVPERPDAVLENYWIIGDKLVLQYLRNASNALEVRALDGAALRDITLPTLGSIYGVSGDPDRDDLYYAFSSFTYPRSIYQGTVTKPEMTLWGKNAVPVDSAAFDVQQVWYTSRDGTKVSMFIVGKKGLPKDGNRRVLLYGYGGFAVNMLPEFDSSIFPWLEAGGLYAVPNLRGGAEYGEDWHKAGMLTKKQNVFDDFIAAAEYLIAEGYTKPERLAISGASNGGLLVAAALTQRPDLFRAVSCGVPLTDMLRYQRFGLGSNWVLEYGSVEDEAQFKALYAYSPYHRVRKNLAYPAVIFLSADHDDRVDPLHARKMAAALQAAAPNGRPILLRIQQNAGHGGASTITAYIDERVDEYAFLMDQVGLTPVSDGVKLYLPMTANGWPPVPEKPSIFVSHLDDGDANFGVEWSLSAGASHYQLQESTAESFANPKDLYDGPAFSFQLSDKTPGTYYYRVRAVNAYGPGDWSAPASAELPPLYVGLSMRWGETEQMRGPIVSDTGARIERKVSERVGFGRFRVNSTVKYNPNPNGHPDESSTQEYDLGTLTPDGNPSPSYPFGLRGAPWILPRDKTPRNGYAVSLSNHAFNVVGPVYYNGLGGSPIPAWKLVNAEDIIVSQDGATAAIMRRGNLVLWYAADATRLLLYYEEHYLYFFRNQPNGQRLNRDGKLTASNAFVQGSVFR